MRYLNILRGSEKVFLWFLGDEVVFLDQCDLDLSDNLFIVRE